MRTLKQLREVLGRGDVHDAIIECMEATIEDAIASHEAGTGKGLTPEQLGAFLLNAIAEAHGNLNDAADKLDPDYYYSPEDEAYEARRQREVDDHFERAA